MRRHNGDPAANGAPGVDRAQRARTDTATALPGLPQRTRPGAALGAFRQVLFAAAGLGLLAACGGDNTPAVRPPASTTSSPATTTTTSTPPSTASATTTTSSLPPSSTTSNPPGSQTVTVTPATGLASGQNVTVTGTGFSANQALVVAQCADKGTETGMGDCNLDGMVTTTSDASGRVEARLTVVVGPFGTNQIVCGPAQPCLVSVTQATPSPTEEADTPISFG